MNTKDALPDFDETVLRESLRFCSPATYAATRAFLHTRDVTHVPAIITGVVESHVERELHAKLQQGGDALRLREDLGLDSLCLMEIVLVLDDVLHVPIANDELARLHTLGEVQQYFQSKVCLVDAASDRGSGTRTLVDSSPMIGALSATQTSG